MKKILVIILIGFLSSCSEKKPNKPNAVDTISVDTTPCCMGDDIQLSGLYEDWRYSLNLCSYDLDHFPYPNSTSESPKFPSQRTKQIPSIDAILFQKLQDQKYIPKYVENLSASGKIADTIKYIKIDSIPKVYYEITDHHVWNMPKTVGKLYQIYADDFVIPHGMALYISDTSSKYGAFVLQTFYQKAIIRLFVKSEQIIYVKGDKFQGQFEYITRPYRLIRDEEVNKPKNVKP